MVDREKVIRGLEAALVLPWTDYDNRNAIYRTIQDALALLKAQEPVRVGKKIKAGDVVLDFYSCGHCKNAIRKPWRYCPFCGRPVKWE